MKNNKCLYKIIIVSSLLLIGCSNDKNTTDISNNLNLDNQHENVFSETNNKSDNTTNIPNTSENLVNTDNFNEILNTSYEVKSKEFFEATDKIYDLSTEIENTIISTTKSVLKEIELDRNEKFELEIINDGSTAINNASNTLKLNLNQIYGIKELTDLPLDIVTKTIVLHEIGHFFTYDFSNLHNTLIFDSVMNDIKVVELTEDEIKELIIMPEEEAWDFVENYMNIEDYITIKLYALATYYDSYYYVLNSDEPVEYTDTFSIILKK